MATIVLSAVGAAVGASVGGAVLGLSSIVIGQAIGATVGRLIDQRILGQGSETVPTGQVDRFRLSGASEGDAVAQVYGRTYVLSGLLRGQAGSDGIIPASWPMGSQVVLMNGVPGQIELAIAARDLARHYRIGPAQRSYDDPSYAHDIHAFAGIGLRPYAPAHLRADKDSAGDYAVSWIRRTRFDGDSWSGVDVPLGEDNEAYVVRVMENGGVVREIQVATPSWIYAAALKTADGVGASFAFEVAQVSSRFGAGLFTRREINE